MLLFLVSNFYAALAMSQELADGSAAEVQILPDGRVVVVNLQGSFEFCINEQDRGCADSASGNARDPNCSCRLLQNPCDFIMANRATGEITDPETVTQSAVDFYAGKDAFSIGRYKSEELLESLKTVGDACFAKAAAGGSEGQSNPTSPGCTLCEEPASLGQPN